MDRKQLYTILLCFWCFGALAQPHELVSASGASFQNGSGYISYSIGEVITTTLSTSSAILSQGFHQTRLRTGVPVIDQPEIRMSVFPNPVKNQLILQIDEHQGFDYLLYNVMGGLLKRGQVLDVRTEIDFSSLAPAIYLLKVTDHKEEVRLFQIVKY